MELNKFGTRQHTNYYICANNLLFYIELSESVLKSVA